MDTTSPAEDSKEAAPPAEEDKKDAGMDIAMFADEESDEDGGKKVLRKKKKVDIEEAPEAPEGEPTKSEKEPFMSPSKKAAPPPAAEPASAAADNGPTNKKPVDEMDAKPAFGSPGRKRP